MNIIEVQFLTDDLDQTRQFYHEVLGFKILSSDSTATSFSAGHSVLTFHKSDNNKPVYHFAFNIPNNKFAEALDWISPRAKLIPTGPSGFVADFKSWNAKAFYFYDNNQNIVEMIARFDLDNSSQEPFGGDSICSVSEIGLVVKDPRLYSAKLLTKYNLQFYSKQQPAEDFIAVGNDGGLFIIVTENRKWYPTNILSTRHWAKVILQLPDGNTEIII